jgi:Protein of unknown function (DUF3383)
MATQPVIPIQNIVEIVVSISPVPPSVPTFNLGLVGGDSAVIPSSERVVQVALGNWSATMLNMGFTTSSPEYVAMGLYFAQSPPPQFGYVGRQDLTAVVSLTVHSGNAGTNYAVGDIGTIAGGSTLAKYQVTAIGAGGAVTTVQVLGGLSSGSGYSGASGAATTATSGSGTGLEVNTVVGESVNIAIQQCRLANFQWYAAMWCGAATADHEAVAAWIQTAQPASFYWGQTSDTAVLNNTTGNLLATLSAAEYGRLGIIYSTTQGGTAPNNVYAAAAVLGVEMGRNTGLANSYFTMANKQLVGIIPEPLTQNQMITIAGSPIQGTFGLYGNVYINVGAAYSVFIQGVCPNGQFADEVLNIDMLASDIQYSCMNVLTSLPAVAQTDPGQVQFLHAVNGAAQRSAIRGFIASTGGIWEGQTISFGTTAGQSLQNGQALPAGYLALSPPVSTLSNTQIAARQAPAVYLAIIESNASQSLLCNVIVQR